MAELLGQRGHRGQLGPESGRDETEYLSSQAAASALGVSERTVRRAIARGELRATKHAGAFRIEPNALAAYRARCDDSAGEHRPAQSPFLPVPLTPIIGRERERAEILEILGDARLLTLTGVGGVGKTRLALEIAREVSQQDERDVCFVPLDTVGTPDAVVPAIAQATGVPLSGVAGIVDELVRQLRDRRILLVLDSFEHAVAAASSVGYLLAHCPDMQILVTSRTPLRIGGEHRYAVLPLCYPEPHEPEYRPLDALACYPAVELFVARARAARPEFTLHQGNVRAITEICARLDGLPLAVELAAARVTLLSPVSLLDQLTQRLTLLTGGNVDQPARHHNLRDTIAWGYELLPADHQALFRRLAVCVGGASLELAAAVSMRPEAEGDCCTVALLDALQGLVDHSLVRRFDGPYGEPRFGMLDTIREYGLEQLAVSGEEAEVRAAHAAWVFRFAKRNEQVPYEPLDEQSLARHAAESGNIRLALNWLSEHDPSAFVELVGTLDLVWWVWSYGTEERAWLARAVALGEADSAARARVLADLGFVLLLADDLHGAEQRFTEALDAFLSLDDTLECGLALLGLGTAALNRADYQVASEHFGLALEHARALPSRPQSSAMVASILRNLGVVARCQGYLEQAEAYHLEALEREHQIGYSYGLMHSYADLGDVARDRGDLVGAGAFYRESLRLVRMHREARIAAWVLEGTAEVIAQRDGRQAARLLGAAHRWREAREIGGQPPRDRAASRRTAVAVEEALGELGFARAWTEGAALTLEEALAEAEDLLARLDRDRHEVVPAVPKLTPREVEVLQLAARNLSDRAIADVLFIGHRTVQNHIARINRKLGVHSRTDAVAAARAAGLIDFQSPQSTEEPSHTLR